MMNKSTATVLSSLILTGALLAPFSAGVAAAEQDFRGRKIVHILQEPRHRTVFNMDNIYLLDVQVNPGDTSFPHTHDAPMLLTFISSGAGPQYGRVSTNTDYAEQNYTHDVSNSGPGLLRILALTSYGEALQNPESDRPVGMGVAPDIENGWFRSYRLSLAPGETTETQTHTSLSFVIQAAEGRVHVSRSDGITAELTAMGDWTFRGPGSSYRIQNVGEASVDVVVNEARN